MRPTTSDVEVLTPCVALVRAGVNAGASTHSRADKGTDQKLNLPWLLKVLPPRATGAPNPSQLGKDRALSAISGSKCRPGAI